MRRALLLLCLALPGCDLNGRELDWPGASVYQPPSKDFHLHYLAPPWQNEAPGPGELGRLSIPATAQGPGTISSSHLLKILVMKVGSPLAAAEAQRQNELNVRHTLGRDLTRITTLTGEEGWDLQSYQDLPQGRAHYRESFFPTALPGQVARLSLLSAYPTDENDIEDLLASYSAGPDPGTPGPERLE
jgi:hypothetical protein